MPDQSRNKMTKRSKPDVMPSSNLFDSALQNLDEEQKREIVGKAAESALRIQEDRAKRHTRSETANDDMDEFVHNYEKAQSGGRRAVYTAEGEFETGSGKVEMKVKKSDCFVATAIYGDSSAPQVIKLRQYRDECLKSYLLGKIFIAIYYKIGPSMASLVNRMPTLQKVLKKRLDRFIERI